jgi:hypothetical protein
MDRSKVGKLILLFLALPFAAYILINFIAGYIPPTESYKKTPYQFEEAFNKQMAQYGMSIDVDSVGFSKEDDYLKKTVPVKCENGSRITCTIVTNNIRKTALMHDIEFEQELTGDKEETVYLVPIMRFILDEFATVMTENKDETLGIITSASYNESLRICNKFYSGNEKEIKFFIYPEKNHGRAVTLTRETGEKASLSISLYLD